MHPTGCRHPHLGWTQPTPETPEHRTTESTTMPRPTETPDHAARPTLTDVGDILGVIVLFALLILVEGILGFAGFLALSWDPLAGSFIALPVATLMSYLALNAYTLTARLITDRRSHRRDGKP